jgi:WD40 repeat protein
MLGNRATAAWTGRRPPFHGLSHEGAIVPTLRLPAAQPAPNGHCGEVFTCAFTPDGAFALSGGWDGHLRLWEAATGAAVTGFSTRTKAVSACAVSPAGRYWLSGSLDGQLSIWDAEGQTLARTFFAHTRPISAIVFGDDENTLVTASWDRSLVLWDLEHERDARALNGHGDIVAGCRFTPDGKRLLSWSHDTTLRVWDLKPLAPAGTLAGHQDRVTTAAISPDGQYAASGSRDGVLKLWDLGRLRELQSLPTTTEVRACFFLLDGASLVTVDMHGRLLLHTVPELNLSAALTTRLAVQCADLDAAGSRIALGCGDGRVYFVSVDGFDEAPLVVTPTQVSRRTATTLQRLLGQSTLKHAYSCTCPVCRHAFEVPKAPPGHPAACPGCRRRLRLSSVLRVAPDE